MQAAAIVILWPRAFLGPTGHASRNKKAFVPVAVGRATH
jgi:hypothetical protein